MSVDLERDLSLLIHKHADLTGRQFVETCLRVAEGFYEPDDLPLLAGVGLLLAEARRHLADD